MHGLANAARFAAYAFALILVLSPVALAQSQQAPSQPRFGSPILTVNQDRLYLESAFGQQFVTEHAAREQALEAENEEIRLALEEEELELTELRSTMAADAFRDLANAFDEKVQNIYRTQNAKGEALNRMVEENRTQFFQTVPPILEGIAREAGAAVILDERVVLIGARSIDITDRAIARIDAALSESEPQPDQ